MRRLPKNTRDDEVRTSRDYQEAHKVPTFVTQYPDPSEVTLHFSQFLPEVDETKLGGVGGYLRCDPAAELVLELTADEDPSFKESLVVQCGERFRRFGMAFVPPNGPIEIHVVLKATSPISLLEIWGLNLDVADLSFLSLSDEERDVTVEDLNKPHLVPETLYLEHTAPSHLSFDRLRGSPSAKRSEGVITVKKCAYCERMLPIDPERLGALAFHKHNAKRTNHQNECRTCKKWRINEHLNELRTANQFHESSLIARERALLLREPEIIKDFKERTGRGLKEIVWERFGKQCFRCEKPLELGEVHIDHTRPLAYLWPIDEHATCLCAECNNYKKDRFPAVVYTKNQLKDLSEITGLSAEELSVQDVCPSQLARIRDNLAEFARGLDPRTFKSIARKVKDVRPDTDLFAELRKRDSTLHEDVLKSLRERPDH